MNPTTIQVPADVRDSIKAAAKRRAAKLGISRLSMVDYLALVAKQES